MVFEDGTWIKPDQEVKGTWNETHHLCNYSDSYCKSQGLQHKNRKRTLFGNDTKFGNCQMLPGQYWIEVMYGTTVTREVIKALDQALNESPKQTARDWKNGRNFIGAALYYGTPLGQFVEVANFVTNPEKYVNNIIPQYRNSLERTEAALVAAEEIFTEVGGTMGGYIHKIPILRAVNRAVQGTMQDQLRFYVDAVNRDGVIDDFSGALEKLETMRKEQAAAALEQMHDAVDRLESLLDQSGVQAVADDVLETAKEQARLATAAAAVAEAEARRASQAVVDAVETTGVDGVVEGGIDQGEDVVEDGIDLVEDTGDFFAPIAVPVFDTMVEGGQSFWRGAVGDFLTDAGSTLTNWFRF